MLVRRRDVWRVGRSNVEPSMSLVTRIAVLPPKAKDSGSWVWCLPCSLSKRIASSVWRWSIPTLVRTFGGPRNAASCQVRI